MGNQPDSMACCVGQERAFEAPKFVATPTKRAAAEKGKERASPPEEVPEDPPPSRSASFQAGQPDELARKVSELEAENMALDSTRVRLLRQITELQAENDRLARSQAETWQTTKENQRAVTSDEAFEWLKKLGKGGNGAAAEGDFPLPPPRPRRTTGDVLVPSQRVPGVPTVDAESGTPPPGRGRAATVGARAFNPESPMVKMSPRCEFFLISANTATDRAAPVVAAEGVAADQADDASDLTSDFDCAASPARVPEPLDDEGMPRLHKSLLASPSPAREPPARSHAPPSPAPVRSPA